MENVVGGPKPRVDIQGEVKSQVDVKLLASRQNDALAPFDSIHATMTAFGEAEEAKASDLEANAQRLTEALFSSAAAASSALDDVSGFVLAALANSSNKTLR